LSRYSRPARTAAIVAASVVATASLTLTAAAVANGGHSTAPKPVAAPPAAPTNANQIQNIGQVASAIKAYYGDTVTKRVDPVKGDHQAVLLHTYAKNGAYAKQMEGIAAKAKAYLKKESTADLGGAKPAIVLDVDDTSLNTFSYEIYANFGYNPDQNADFVNHAVFPAVPGMPGLAQYATNHGYTLFFLTGRPADQLKGTNRNLKKVGFPAAQQVYLKDQTKPWLASCAPDCTTIQYKSLTRQYIQSQGYRIVGNFGDQFSDLKGGFEMKRFKLPNPMYFLP
jgi:predicted secreted acid phosphatase